MKILGVSARNFKTLEDVNVRFNANYCTLSGQNNAGKTAIVQIITQFLEDHEDDFVSIREAKRIKFPRDRTQWNSQGNILIGIDLELDSEEDSEVFYVVRKMTPFEIRDRKVILNITQEYSDESNISTACLVNGKAIESQSASEIVKKLQSTSNIFVHNSTLSLRRYEYFGGGLIEVIDAHLTPADKKRISDAEANLQNKVKQAVKQHKEALSQLLGKLSGAYQVELSAPARALSSKFSLNVKLNDKSVEVPLSAWGSGTQNRTKILISILDAVQIRSSKAEENRSTPVVIIEEPESFLHPTAQAEFGKILNELADDLGIQIIATTHSPYMLNQSAPGANILLCRAIQRRKYRETFVQDTTGKNWMLPFAENLGIIPQEFDAWKSVITVKNSKVLLVEGDLDKKYILKIKELYPAVYCLPDDIEIIDYGGKDALKNTQMLKFMLSKFSDTFITYDLDAERDVKNILERIGLSENVNFCAVGYPQPGKECIEGLLPDATHRAVYGAHYEVVQKLQSADTKIRRDAKDELKAKLLEEFSRSTYEVKDLTGFSVLFRKIAKAYLMSNGS